MVGCHLACSGFFVAWDDDDPELDTPPTAVASNNKLQNM
jgi:hypothetical protein